MNISLGFIDSEGQVLVKEFKADNLGEIEKVQVQDLVDFDLKALFYESDESLQLIKDEEKTCPLFPLEKFSLTPASFTSLSYQDAFQIFQKSYTHWVLENNLSTLENIFVLTEHLKSLWKKEPDTFFKELWQLLKMNLGLQDLRIVYNDVKLAEKEGQKDQLVHSYLVGNKKPVLNEGGEIEEKLLEQFPPASDALFDICEHDKNNGHFVATCSIEKSPILMMGHTHQLTALQKSLMQSIFTGLQN